MLIARAAVQIILNIDEERVTATGDVHHQYTAALIDRQHDHLIFVRTIIDENILARRDENTSGEN